MQRLNVNWTRIAFVKMFGKEGHGEEIRETTEKGIFLVVGTLRGGGGD